MPVSNKKPRVLVVTPEVTYLPKGMGNMANMLTAKAGGLADVSAALISALFDQGGDVFVALPDYRSIFSDHFPDILKDGLQIIKRVMPDDRIHLAKDRIFFYMHNVYSYDGDENIKIALAFQREVINNIIPRVNPDLIHCNDWMTGLIPSMARQLGIPCLFTIHNIYTVANTMENIEDRGIDTAAFWKHLFFKYPPVNYEESRSTNPVDFLLSGIFASHYVNTVSPTFLMEMINGYHDFVEDRLQAELSNKWRAGCALGILNSPDTSFNPKTDKALRYNYSAKDHVTGKIKNKQLFQKKVGLEIDDNAPIFFWPSRLDTVQKGCSLLAEIMYEVVSDYWDENFQIAFVANGPFQQHFKDIVDKFNLQKRVAICDFNEQLARQAYGAVDFVLMPSKFEPCGLPQMIGPIYGALPVAHDTGGIHDTVTDIDVDHDKGNGFLFTIHDSKGLRWSIDQAMKFYNLPVEIKQKQIERVMAQSLATFSHDVTANNYINLYSKMLQRPFFA